MKQALFIIIALMQVSFFAFNIQRWKLNSDLKVWRTEVQMIATGVAAELLDEAGTMDFEDLEDVDQILPTTRQVVLEGITIPYTVVAGSDYVQKQGNYFIPVSGETTTNFQKVHLTITPVINSEILTNSAITASRIYSSTSN